MITFFRNLIREFQKKKLTFSEIYCSNLVQMFDFGANLFKMPYLDDEFPCFKNARKNFAVWFYLS